MKRILVSGTVLLSAVLLTAGCSAAQTPDNANKMDSPTPSQTPLTVNGGAGSSSAPSSSTAPIKAALTKASAASSFEAFYTHFFSLPKTTINELVQNTSTKGQMNTTTKSMTAAEAKAERTKLESIDPQLKAIDSTGKTDLQVVQLYESFLPGLAFFTGQGFSAKVNDVNKITLTGTTASLPSTDVTLLQNGKPYTASAGSTISFTGTDGGPAVQKFVNGTWVFKIA
jgi:hypothetical protein